MLCREDMSIKQYAYEKGGNIWKNNIDEDVMFVV
jgi:hypothetical protein